MASLMNDILDGVVTRLQALTLTGISSSSIVKRRLPFTVKDIAVLPGIAVCPVGMMDYPSKLTGTDNYGFPVMVCIQKVNNHDFSSSPDAELNWREQCERALVSQRLTGVDTFPATLKPKPLFDVGMLFNHKLWHMEIYLEYVARRTRGVT